MDTPAERHAPFLNWLDEWYDSLPRAGLREILQEAGGPSNVAVLVVDLLVGFCSEGPLASPRIAALGKPTAEFLTAARRTGVENVVLAMDAHPPDSPEFAAFPPHCVRGTHEADLIADLAELPFAGKMARVPKGSLNVGLEPPFEEWLAAHPGIRAWILLGDCTDLCVYSAAMHLRLRANALGRQVSIWVPADLVDTYDLPVETARQIGALPHDGDLAHRYFLYHLALNGVRVVRSVTP